MEAAKVLFLIAVPLGLTNKKKVPKKVIFFLMASLLPPPPLLMALPLRRNFFAASLKSIPFVHSTQKLIYKGLIKIIVLQNKLCLLFLVQD